MAKQLGFYVEIDKCVECHACEVACKGFHQLELGIKLRRVTKIWTGTYPDVRSTAVSMACAHCGQPACMKVCPKGAISKRPEDGIVVVDHEKCIGCRACFAACPFGVPQYGEDGKMQKCDLCLERLENGEEPACVKTCPAGALHYGTMEELSELVNEKFSLKLVSTTVPSVVMTK